jgi:hypothetical protein
MSDDSASTSSSQKRVGGLFQSPPAKRAKDTSDPDDSSSSSDGDDLQIFTPDEMMVKGLLLLGWTEHQIGRVQDVTNLERFRSHFGADPDVLAQIWEDLQTTEIAAANINRHFTDRMKKDVKDFFATMHFLKRYETENERERTWRSSKNTIRRNGWFYVDHIRALKADKIVWPKSFGDLIWVLTVDGTHLRTYEPNHPELPKDPANFSYKHHCAGYNYEIALSLTESKLIWMSGPWPAGTYNDIKIFKEKGLARKLQKHGKKGIADSGYNGYPQLLSLPNNKHDDKEVMQFKSRARLRHEGFNRMLKTFDCLSDTFRHSKEQLQACFETVAVVVQYKMERGYPLYDI